MKDGILYSWKNFARERIINERRSAREKGINKNAPIYST